MGLLAEIVTDGWKASVSSTFFLPCVLGAPECGEEQALRADGLPRGKEGSPRATRPPRCVASWMRQPYSGNDFPGPLFFQVVIV